MHSLGLNLQAWKIKTKQMLTHRKNTKFSTEFMTEHFKWSLNSLSAHFKKYIPYWFVFEDTYFLIYMKWTLLMRGSS